MELMFSAKVRRLGNSNAVVIPAWILRDLGLKNDDTINVIVSSPDRPREIRGTE